MKYFKIILFFLMISTGLACVILGFLPASAATIDSESLMAKINQERTNRNISALITSGKLVAAAEAKTRDMFERDYFDHVDPDGRYVWFRIEDAGYKPYKTLGENLAIDFSTEDGIVKAWINSPSHRDNLLNSAFADQGLSAQYGDFQQRYTSIVTSLFGTLITKSPVPPLVTPPATPQTLTTQPVVQSDRLTTAPLKNQSPPAETKMIVEAPSKSEPAITLSTVSESTSTSATSSSFATYIPISLTGDEQNTYAALRWVFIFLTSIFILTYAMDILKRESFRRAFAKKNQLPLLLLLALVCLLSANIY